jgi:hypothetical protein
MIYLYPAEPEAGLYQEDGTLIALDGFCILQGSDPIPVGFRFYPQLLSTGVSENGGRAVGELGTSRIARSYE